MTHAEALAVMKAAKEGKPIQFRLRDMMGGWYDRTESQTPDFNFFRYDYRIKPEPPKPREWWFINDLGCENNRCGWTRHDVRQEGVDYLEQIHVREILP
jgi:hypothetical protein